MDEDSKVDKLEQELARIKAEKEERKPGALDKIPGRVKMGFIAGLVLVVWWGMNHEWEIKTIGMWVGVGVIILWIMGSQAPEMQKKRLLTSMESRQCLRGFIRRLKMSPIGDFPEIQPTARVEIGLNENLLTKDGKPIYRVHKVRIYNPQTHLAKVYKVFMEPFEGEVMKWIETPEGMFGDEMPDIKTIFPPEALAYKKYENLIGKSSKP